MECVCIQFWVARQVFYDTELIRRSDMQATGLMNEFKGSER